MELIPEEWITAWLLVFLRTSGMLTVFPLFSSPVVPPRLRVAIGFFTASLLAPLIPSLPIPTSLFHIVGLMALEVGVGLLLGFICRLVFFGLEVAGGLMGMEMGLQMAFGVNPATGSQSSAPGAVLYYMAIVLWLGLDLHHWLLAAFQRSYVILPIGVAHLNQFVLAHVLARTGELFVIALRITAPILAVSFIISLVFAMLGRTVPQMNVFSESFALRILAGLSVFGFTCQLMSQHIINYLSRLPEDMLLVARAMTF